MFPKKKLYIYIISYIYNLGLPLSKKVGFICFKESTLKAMKNAFSFTLKVLFRSYVIGMFFRYVIGKLFHLRKRFDK